MANVETVLYETDEDQILFAGDVAIIDGEAYLFAEVSRIKDKVKCNLIELSGHGFWSGKLWDNGTKLGDIMGVPLEGYDILIIQDNDCGITVRDLTQK